MVESSLLTTNITARESYASNSSVLNINVGVLGHIDSGKTSISKALSTVCSTACFDKDPQSTLRGITLDLGFSSFFYDFFLRKENNNYEEVKKALSSPREGGDTGDLPPAVYQRYVRQCGLKGVQFTLVDCPGHASLIRTIISGSAIIDVMLLVIDVSKGIQAQTKECLVLGGVLGRRIVVVLNKIDLINVNEEKLREKAKEKVEKSAKKNSSENKKDAQNVSTNSPNTLNNNNNNNNTFLFENLVQKTILKERAIILDKMKTRLRTLFAQTRWPEVLFVEVAAAPAFHNDKVIENSALVSTERGKANTSEEQKQQEVDSRVDFKRRVAVVEAEEKAFKKKHKKDTQKKNSFVDNDPSAATGASAAGKPKSINIQSIVNALLCTVDPVKLLLKRNNLAFFNALSITATADESASHLSLNSNNENNSRFTFDPLLSALYKIYFGCMGNSFSSLSALNALHFRNYVMYIDHCFSVKGQGIILTGTISSGMINSSSSPSSSSFISFSASGSSDSALGGNEIYFPELATLKRVKSIQVFHKSVPYAAHGDRVGICLATGLDASLMERGIVVSAKSNVLPTGKAMSAGDKGFFMPYNNSGVGAAVDDVIVVNSNRSYTKKLQQQSSLLQGKTGNATVGAVGKGSGIAAYKGGDGLSMCAPINDIPEHITTQKLRQLLTVLLSCTSKLNMLLEGPVPSSNGNNIINISGNISDQQSQLTMTLNSALEDLKTLEALVPVKIIKEKSSVPSSNSYLLSQSSSSLQTLQSLSTTVVHSNCFIALVRKVKFYRSNVFSHNCTTSASNETNFPHIGAGASAPAKSSSTKYHITVGQNTVMGVMRFFSCRNPYYDYHSAQHNEDQRLQGMPPVSDFPFALSCDVEDQEMQAAQIVAEEASLLQLNSSLLCAIADRKYQFFIEKQKVRMNAATLEDEKEGGMRQIMAATSTVGNSSLCFPFGFDLQEELLEDVEHEDGNEEIKQESEKEQGGKLPQSETNEFKNFYCPGVAISPKRRRRVVFAVITLDNPVLLVSAISTGSAYSLMVGSKEMLTTVRAIIHANSSSELAKKVAATKPQNEVENSDIPDAVQLPSFSCGVDRSKTCEESVTYDKASLNALLTLMNGQHSLFLASRLDADINSLNAMGLCRLAVEGTILSVLANHDMDAVAEAGNPGQRAATRSSVIPHIIDVPRERSSLDFSSKESDRHHLVFPVEDLGNTIPHPLPIDLLCYRSCALSVFKLGSAYIDAHHNTSQPLFLRLSSLNTILQSCLPDLYRHYLFSAYRDLHWRQLPVLKAKYKIFLVDKIQDDFNCVIKCTKAVQETERCGKKTSKAAGTERKNNDKDPIKPDSTTILRDPLRFVSMKLLIEMTPVPIIKRNKHLVNSHVATTAKPYLLSSSKRAITATESDSDNQWSSLTTSSCKLPPNYFAQGSITGVCTINATKGGSGNISSSYNKFYNDRGNVAKRLKVTFEEPVFRRMPKLQGTDADPTYFWKSARTVYLPLQKFSFGALGSWRQFVTSAAG